MTEPPLKAAIIPVTPLQQNCSLIWCTKTMLGAFVDPGTGDAFAFERAVTAGGFGYAGSSQVRTTTSPIAGTDRDPLSQDLRSGMSA